MDYPKASKEELQRYVEELQRLKASLPKDNRIVVKITLK